MRPEGAPAPTDKEGTRIDEGARHAFFSFKGELKSDLPDATETDFAGSIDLPAADDADATSDEPGDETTDSEDTQVESPDAADTALESASPDAAAEATASGEIQAQEQSRAGPVRGPDPAASEKTASQSRKAAGPAHFTSETH
jgi:hypothetical protein